MYIIKLFKIITTFIRSSFICFENYEISILNILNKFIPIKNEIIEQKNLNIQIYYYYQKKIQLIIFIILLLKIQIFK
jgi:hypothetical protein